MYWLRFGLRRPSHTVVRILPRVYRTRGSRFSQLLQIRQIHKFEISLSMTFYLGLH